MVILLVAKVKATIVSLCEQSADYEASGSSIINEKFKGYKKENIVYRCNK